MSFKLVYLVLHIENGQFKNNLNADQKGFFQHWDQLNVFVWSQFLGTYQSRDVQFTCYREEQGCIEQGPIVQGPTLTGTHETGMRRHSTELQQASSSHFCQECNLISTLIGFPAHWICCIGVFTGIFPIQKQLNPYCTGLKKQLTMHQLSSLHFNKRDN